MSDIAFVDLAAQRQRLGGRIEQAISRVLDHGSFILGPEVAELERRLAAFSGAKHCVTCANGTDALQLIFMAEGIGPGDAIFVPAFTFVASAEMVPLTGAVPFFVDIRETDFALDPASLERAIADARQQGLRPRMVVPVDLFGHPADYDAIGVIAAREGMLVLADAAQSFGGSYKGRKVGALATYTTTSFFPAKPLGCYGDGGAVFTDDDDRAALLRSLRFHGKGSDKYDNVRIGLNSRLDTIQAAVLLEKLAIFDEELVARDRVAARYTAALGNVVQVPRVADGCSSAWAQYTLILKDRDGLAQACKQAGIPTNVYYPITMNKQSGYRSYPVVSGGVPVSDRLATSVLSLPMHPYLKEADQDRIIAAVTSFVRT